MPCFSMPRIRRQQLGYLDNSLALKIGRRTFPQLSGLLRLPSLLFSSCCDLAERVWLISESSTSLLPLNWRDNRQSRNVLDGLPFAVLADDISRIVGVLAIVTFPEACVIVGH